MNHIVRTVDCHAGNEIVHVAYTVNNDIIGNLFHHAEQCRDFILCGAWVAVFVFARRIAEETKVEAVCLRIFNAYGPGQRVTLSNPPIIPNFLKHALTNGSIVIHGDGNQTRDYVYLDDVIDAIIAAGKAVGVDQEIINIGSGVETSVNELARLVRLVTDRKPEHIFNPKRDGGADRMCADISKAGRLLNYVPKVPLESGLRLTIEKDPLLQV